MKLCAWAILFFFPLQIFADESSVLSTDSRIRITAPTVFSNPLTGNILQIRPDTLLLSPHTRIPLHAISKLELSLGVQPLKQRITSNAWKGALLAGGIVSAALMNNWDDWDNRSGNKALLSIVGGTVVGGTLGGLFGIVHRPEQWTTLSPSHLKHHAPPAYRLPAQK